MKEHYIFGTKIDDYLLGLILTDDMMTHKIKKIEKNTIFYSWINEYDDKEVDETMTVYEFAFKCVDFLMRRGYRVAISSTPTKFGVRHYLNLWYENKIQSKYGYRDELPDAIIESCVAYIKNNEENIK